MPHQRWAWARVQELCCFAESNEFLKRSLEPHSRAVKCEVLSKRQNFIANLTALARMSRLNSCSNVQKSFPCASHFNRVWHSSANSSQRKKQCFSFRNLRTLVSLIWLVEHSLCAPCAASSFGNQCAEFGHTVCSSLFSVHTVCSVFQSYFC